MMADCAKDRGVGGRSDGGWGLGERYPIYNCTPIATVTVLGYCISQGVP